MSTLSMVVIQWCFAGVVVVPRHAIHFTGGPLQCSTRHPNFLRSEYEIISAASRVNLVARWPDSGRWRRPSMQRSSRNLLSSYLYCNTGRVNPGTVPKEICAERPMSSHDRCAIDCPRRQCTQTAEIWSCPVSQDFKAPCGAYTHVRYASK